MTLSPALSLCALVAAYLLGWPALAAWLSDHTPLAMALPELLDAGIFLGLAGAMMANFRRARIGLPFLACGALAVLALLVQHAGALLASREAIAYDALIGLGQHAGLFLLFVLRLEHILTLTFD